MHKCLKLKIIFYFFWMSIGFAAEKPYSNPQFANPLIDVLSYDLKIKVPGIEPADLEVKIEALLTVKLQKAAQFIDLHYQDGLIEGMSVSDSQGLMLQHQIIDHDLGTHKHSRLKNTYLRVYLGKEFLSGQTVKVKLSYGLKRDPFLNAKNRNYEGSIITPGVLYNHSEFKGYKSRQQLGADNWPYYIRYWLPGNDHPSDHATFSAELRVPNGSIGAASGELLEGTFEEGSGLDAEGLRVFRWRQDTEIAPYAFNFVIGTFSIYSGEISLAGKTVPYAFYTGNNLSRMPAEFREAFENAKKAAEYFSEIFGEYPYAKLGFIFSQQRFNMEYASLVTFRNPQQLVHELLHQWWGNAVGIGDWPDLWISEGPTTYLTKLFRIHSGEIDKENYDELLRGAPVGNLLHKSEADPLEMASSFYSRESATVYGLHRQIAYMINEPMVSEKGLRAFYGVLRELYQSHKHQTLNTSQLYYHLEQSIPQVLKAQGYNIPDERVRTLVQDWGRKWLGQCERLLTAH